MAGPAADLSQIERTRAALGLDGSVSSGAGGCEHVVGGTGDEVDGSTYDLDALQRSRRRVDQVAHDIAHQMRLRVRVDVQLVRRGTLIETDEGQVGNDVARDEVHRGGQRLNAAPRKGRDIASPSRLHNGEVDHRRRERTGGAHAIAVGGGAALEAVVTRRRHVERPDGIGSDLAAGKAGVEQAARSNGHEDKVGGEVAKRLCPATALVANLRQRLRAQQQLVHAVEVLRRCGGGQLFRGRVGECGRHFTGPGLRADLVGPGDVSTPLLHHRRRETFTLRVGAGGGSEDLRGSDQRRAKQRGRRNNCFRFHEGSPGEAGNEAV
jgi:hypothetical protein